MELKTSKWEASVFNILGEVQNYCAKWVLRKIDKYFSLFPQENATDWFKKEKKIKLYYPKLKRFDFA